MLRRLQWFGLLSLLGCSTSRLDETDPNVVAGRKASAQQASIAVQAHADADALARQEEGAAVASIENDRGEPPRALSQDEFGRVLRYHCGDCHEPPPESVEGAQGLFHLDLDLLISTGKVIPGDGVGSLLVMRVARGEMPPPSSGDEPMPAATLQLLIDFIDSLPPAG